MELFALLSIILFYLLTPGILVNIKGNKYTIAICHAIIFSILFGIIQIQTNKPTFLKEKLGDDFTTPVAWTDLGQDHERTGAVRGKRHLMLISLLTRMARS
jgi:hypothetical protein